MRGEGVGDVVEKSGEWRGVFVEEGRQCRGERGRGVKDAQATAFEC